MAPIEELSYAYDQAVFKEKTLYSIRAQEILYDKA
jgi:hypothetical protein